MRRAWLRLIEVRRAVIWTNQCGPSDGGERFPFLVTLSVMRMVRAGAAALCLAAATAACSGSGSDTGSAGGWRVSGTHIRTVLTQPACTTPAPVVDTFSKPPTPQPGCSSAPKNIGDADATPASSPAAAQWQSVHVERQYHGDSGDTAAAQQAQSQWHPIYTTYTAPPGTGIYQPMVHATNQPMPTPPFATPTPAAMQTQAPLRTPAPAPTTSSAPMPAAPAATP